MYRKRSKRAARIRFLLTYTLAPMLIVALVTVLAMYMIGYRFNPVESTITQGSLVQLDSAPSSATVTFDDKTLSSRTAARLNATTGIHTVTMSRDGYYPWQKTVTVEAGEILWLNYALLVPTTLNTETIYSYDTLASVSAMPGSEKLAVVPGAHTPQIDIVTADSGDAPRQSLTLPAALYAAGSSGQEHTFTIDRWDESMRYLLVRHSVGATKEWLLVDTSSVDRSVNVSSIVDQPVSQAQFDAKNSQHIYIIASGVLRRVNTDDKTISAPLATNVTRMQQDDNGVLTLVTTDTDAKQRTVSYLTPGASTAKPLLTTDNMTAPLGGQVAEYAHKHYRALLKGSTLEIAETDLPSSDSDQQPSPTVIAQLPLADAASTVSFSPSYRFVVAQRASALVVYDLELDQRHAFSLQTTDATAVRWFDDHHMYVRDTAGQLRWYEFDGANSRALLATAKGSYDMSLTDNSRYFYTVQTKDTGAALVRVRLAE